MERYSSRTNKTKRRIKEPLDYHEGLSSNQVKIIFYELGLEHRLDQFKEWVHGRICPIIPRRCATGILETGGVYEYDLFMWIKNQKKGTPLV